MEGWGRESPKNVFLSRRGLASTTRQSSPPLPYGIVLVDCRHGGIVVAHLVGGGLAERDGRLRVGDHILAVNGRRPRDSAEALALTLASSTCFIRAYTPGTSRVVVLV